MNHNTEGTDGHRGTLEIADDASESIRTLNHLTQQPAAQVLTPADIDQVVAALSQAADRLPQLLRQIGDLLRHRQQAGLLRVDQASPLPDPASAVIQATSALRQAAGHASRTGRAMDAAHQILAHLATSTGASPVVGECGPGKGRSTPDPTRVQSPVNQIGSEPPRRHGEHPLGARRRGGGLSR